MLHASFLNNHDDDSSERKMARAHEQTKMQSPMESEGNADHGEYWENSKTTRTKLSNSFRSSTFNPCAKTTKSPIFTFHLLLIILCLTIPVAMSRGCGLSEAMCNCIAQGWGYKTCASQHFKRSAPLSFLNDRNDQEGAYKRWMQSAAENSNLMHKRHADLSRVLNDNDFETGVKSKRAFLNMMGPNYKK